MSIPFPSRAERVSGALLLVLAALAGAGCQPQALATSTTPAAIAPEVDTSAPLAAGQGRLVVDVEDGPVTVERIQLEPQPANAPGEGTIQRWRFEERPEVLCASTPCVVDLPVGNVLLGFPTLGSEELVTRVLVHVSEEPTVYRRALDQYFPRRAGMLGVGVPSLLVGLGSASAGAALLPQGLDRDDRGRTIAGAVTLGVGVALFAIGYWLIKQGRHSLRPGASVHF
ncbi:MAG: hypothetical protein CMN30_18680 [Sandaracinus sp.]|nr:hypothetical protein [Sandaracinus sp.]